MGLSKKTVGERNFPKVLDKRGLEDLGAVRIDESTYYKVVQGNVVGIYEPVQPENPNSSKTEKRYSLRHIKKEE